MYVQKGIEYVIRKMELAFYYLKWCKDYNYEEMSVERYSEYIGWEKKLQALGHLVKQMNSRKITQISLNMPLLLFVIITHRSVALINV